MKTFINLIFNPHLADDEQKDDNDNDVEEEDPNIASSYNEENPTQGSAVDEVGA